MSSSSKGPQHYVRDIGHPYIASSAFTNIVLHGIKDRISPKSSYNTKIYALIIVTKLGVEASRGTLPKPDNDGWWSKEETELMFGEWMDFMGDVVVYMMSGEERMRADGDKELRDAKEAWKSCCLEKGVLDEKEFKDMLGV